MLPSHDALSNIFAFDDFMHHECNSFQLLPLFTHPYVIVDFLREAAQASF